MGELNSQEKSQSRPAAARKNRRHPIRSYPPPCGRSGILALFPDSRSRHPHLGRKSFLPRGRENGRNPFSQYSLVFKTQKISGIDVQAIPWGLFPLLFRIRDRRRLAEETGSNLHVLGASGGGLPEPQRALQRVLLSFFLRGVSLAGELCLCRLCLLLELAK